MLAHTHARAHTHTHTHVEVTHFRPAREQLVYNSLWIVAQSDR